MHTVELAPEVARGRISKCVKDITGVLPNITIACNTRVAFTIDKDLTPAELLALQLALNDLPHFNWGVSFHEVSQ